MADELSAMGVIEDAEAWAENHYSEDTDEPFEIWSENLPSFEVFIRCTWQRQALPNGKLIPTGIAAGEVRDVAELMGVERCRWPGLLDDVRFMAGVVLPILQR